MESISTQLTTPQKSSLEWRNITSSSANAVLAMTCSTNSGSAICRLTHMRDATSWPISPALSESARPKRSANSDTERSQKMVSVILALPSLLASKYSGLS